MQTLKITNKKLNSAAKKWPDMKYKSLGNKYYIVRHLQYDPFFYPSIWTSLHKLKSFQVYKKFKPEDCEI